MLTATWPDAVRPVGGSGLYSCCGSCRYSSGMRFACSRAAPIWIVVALSFGAPASAINVDTSRSRRSVRYSAMRRTTAARSAPGMFAQMPSSNVRRAAPIACSIWSTDAVSTSAMIASVAGFSTASVGPSPETYLPSMNDCRPSTNATIAASGWLSVRRPYLTSASGIHRVPESGNARPVPGAGQYLRGRRGERNDRARG